MLYKLMLCLNQSFSLVYLTNQSITFIKKYAIIKKNGKFVKIEKL